MEITLPEEARSFLESWTDCPNREAFVTLARELTDHSDVSLDFKARPGVTYSLRSRRNGQKEDLYCMIDVIDDDPADRWLSVCFFSEMISDPDEMGDFVPGGLLGQDGTCFDLDCSVSNDTAYIRSRIREAYANCLPR
jgi:hypothetical protein